jgi:hypothetical protein
MLFFCQYILLHTSFKNFRFDGFAFTARKQPVGRQGLVAILLLTHAAGR